MQRTFISNQLDIKKITLNIILLLKICKFVYLVTLAEFLIKFKIKSKINIVVCKLLTDLKD